MTDPTVTAAYHQDAITTVTLCSPDPLIEHPGVTVEVTWTLGRHDDALRALRAAVADVEAQSEKTRTAGDAT